MMKRLILGVAIAMSAGLVEAQALIERYKAGEDYFVLNQAQPTSVSSNKVEVLEVFSYACSHCATFHPYVEAGKKKMPSHAQMVYMPAVFGRTDWELMARVFYTAKAFGVVDKTHAAVFDAVHNSQTPARSVDDFAALFAKHGVKPAAFKSTMSSFAVNMEIDRVNSILPRYKVEGTPEVFVAGKYRITGASAKGYDKVFDVVNFLVEKEAAARGLKKTVAIAKAPVKTVVKPAVTKPATKPAIKPAATAAKQ